MKAESNGVTTIIQPHGWSWVDQPLVGATSDGLNVYAVTVPQSISNCYRYGFKISLRFCLSCRFTLYGEVGLDNICLVTRGSDLGTV